jgi:hypothetical protein
MLEWFNFYLKDKGPQPRLIAEVQDNMGGWRVEPNYPPPEQEWIYFDMDSCSIGGFNPPPPHVILNLGNQSGLWPLVLEIEIEPLQHIISPIPTQCIRECLGSPAGVQAFVAASAVRIVVAPLPVEALDIKAGLKQSIVYWESHVRVDVPILQTVDDVHRAVVIL